MNSRLLTTSTARLALSAALLLLPSAARVSGQPPAAPPDCKPLPAGAGAEHNIGIGEKHCFTFELQPDEFFQARVEQKGVDLLLRLLDAGGKELARMNSPNDKEGPEVLTHVAAAAGSYTLEVTPPGAQGGSGAYAIRREAARPATPQDRRRVEVGRLLAEGMAAGGKERARLAFAVEKLSAAEAGWRELGDTYMAEITARRAKRTRAVYLFHDGHTIFKISQTPESLNSAAEKLRESKRLFVEVNDRHGEAGALVGLAIVTHFGGEKRAALDGFKQALSLYLVTGSRMEEAHARSSIANISLELGDRKTGLEQMLLALPIHKELGRDVSVADTENDIGAAYLGMGEYGPALEHFERALAHKRKLKDVCSLAVTLTNIALVHSAKGEKARALNLLTEQALPLYPADGTCADNRAATLTNIGKVYNDLGEHAEALEKHREALRILLAAGGAAALKDEEAAVRANIGVTYFVAREHAAALKSFGEALTLYRHLRDKEREATLLTNVGVVEAAQGDRARALETFREALGLRVEVGDMNGEAITMNNLGETYLALGEAPKALEHFIRSLPLFRSAGDRSGEAVALGNAMTVARRLGARRMAIFYGKQSVNKFQELRGAARVRDHEIQRNYLRTIKGPYEELTESLMEESLYEQAVQVLNLYQDQQFFDFDHATRSVGQVEFTERERGFIERHGAAGEAVGEVGGRVEDLRRTFVGRLPSGEESAQLTKLLEELRKAEDAAVAVIKEAEAEFARPPDAKDRAGAVTEVSKMREALGALDGPPPQKALALYTLTGSKRFYVMLVTPDGLEAFSSPAKEEAVNAKVATLYEFLKEPGFPINKASAALYNIIFKATSTRRAGVTLEVEVDARRPDVLLWSLNGSLNYISVAALYDAARKQYLVEKYQNAVFTRADNTRLLRESSDWTRGIGFGKSSASRLRCEDEERPSPTTRGGGAATPLGPLTFVPRELSTIFLGARGRAPLVPGRVLLERDFKLDTLLDNLKGKDVPLVHISSHFCLRSGDAKSSFLLLGDDTPFTLYEMKEHRGLFDGVDLLVLSACRSAALRSRPKTGEEVDSLAEMSQRLGARSVIATLWNTGDAGSGRLMIEFYRLRADFPELSKAELLRRAQLRLLRGETKHPGVNLSHPSYWSAFVLYGSFR